MHRRLASTVVLTLSLCAVYSGQLYAQPAVSVSFRNILREGGFVAQFEQLDADGAVVGLTEQRVENGAIGTISVVPGTRFNLRLLPDGGGGHVRANRDLAADFAANGNNPIDLEGKFDATGRRIAILMHIGAKTIVLPRMEYGMAGYAEQCETPSCTCLPADACKCRNGFLRRLFSW
jgi:hypothetical protein